MADEPKCALQKWIAEITQAEPALSDSKPEGWVDFRDRELSKLCRFGVFVRIDSISPRCKVLVGSEALAIEAKEALHRLGFASTIEDLGAIWAVLFDPPESIALTLDVIGSSQHLSWFQTPSIASRG